MNASLDTIIKPLQKINTKVKGFKCRKQGKRFYGGQAGRFFEVNQHFAESSVR